ncbi:long-chain fatty acid--CoA ligase [Peribacillus kribbensis]|uniref:long-chain fatty acid--CoA ligase n=1 Tax=Peribacillus kribbensis TaxID=356658 RepID=UPI00041C1AA1|nr:long-chain fatty acid--CoA ligase [Peribacillus kribbensis]
MNTRHYPYWPKRLTKSLTVPETPLFDNLLVSARRYPEKSALHFYGADFTYRQLLNDAEKLAGYLEQILHVKQGDRVLLFMQNSPQFLISFYAILRIRAVVVPINPMNTSNELEFYIKDCGIRTGIIGHELLDTVFPLLKDTSLDDLAVAAYSEYTLPEKTEVSLPKEAQMIQDRGEKIEGIHVWRDILEADLSPGPFEGECDDIAVLPYTSGTTGLPKGCIHTNRTVQANAIGAVHWMNSTSDSVHLTSLPLFHVTGMLHSMHAPILAGSSMVMMTRWDRNTAASLMETKRCTHWVNISTMVIDFLANPNLDSYNISSLSSIAGGGAALPQAVGEKLLEKTGLRYVEGYGLSETISHTHFNPPDRPKMQCLGIPSFDVDARIIDPATMKELAAGVAGEIVVSGPQVFKGYFERPEETGQSFFERDGKRFFRTGDIGRFDEEGYYFMVDRVKRMINASGYKVWPTEVESFLYHHPAVEQACVVGIPDPKRGETVKAFIILKENYPDTVKEEDIIEWAKEKMAAYKYPRVIEFRNSFPTTASGKILWRKLQEEEGTKIGAVE